MKKSFVCVLVLIVAVFTLASCNTGGKTATPGEVQFYVRLMDELTLYNAGYRTAPEWEGELMTALDLAFDYDAPENALTSIDFNGKQYAVRFFSSVNGFLHRTWMDEYKVESNDGEMSAFYVDRDSGELIGYGRKAILWPVASEDALSRDELINIAREGLGEFMDASYYANADIEYDPQFFDYEVTFYNTVGDVQVADESTVYIRADGTLTRVLALPEPDLLKALRRISDIDAAAFDAKIVSEAREAYPDYRRDDAERYADVVFDGIDIVARRLTLDDDGNPIVAYSLKARLKYEHMYRGDAANIIAERGMEVHTTGVYEPSAYAAVKIELSN